MILTAPITSASKERSFLKLKLIKTFMHSVVKQDRLKDLLTLGCGKDIRDQIDLEKLVDRSAELPKTRRIIRVE